MNEKQKEFLAQSGINLTDGLAYFSENERLYREFPAVSYSRRQEAR
jgi:hypothetical protein